MKQLFIMRHGEAAIQADTDRDRALTVYGEQQTAANVKTLKNSVSSVDLCLVSPYRRAQETARIVSRVIHCNDFADSELITPDADCRIAVEVLSELFLTNNSIFIVSHMPFVAGLANFLAADMEEPVCGFTPAMIVKIEFEVFGQSLGSVKNY